MKVTKKAKDFEAGWGESWSGCMNNNINKKGIIQTIGEDGIKVFFNDGSNLCPNRGYSYPYFILEKTEKPKRKLEPFDKVLVRYDKDTWRPDIFLYYHSEMILDDEYVCSRGMWEYCIPYEGNEHLNGTTDEPEE